MAPLSLEGLSKKQIRAVNAAIDARYASTPAASKSTADDNDSCNLTRKVNENAVSIVRNKSDMVVATQRDNALEKRIAVLERGFLSSGEDIRATQEYRDKFAAWRGDKSLRPPIPIIKNHSSMARYAYVYGSTAPLELTVPAGETCTIQFRPNLFYGPVRTCTTTTGGTVGFTATGIGWSKNSAVMDIAELAGTCVNGDWIRHDPCKLFYDPGCIKSGDAIVKKPDANTSHPPLVQLLAGGMTIKSSVPYNGMCTVRALSEGSNPTVVGRKQERVPLDVPLNMPSAIGIDPAFVGHLVSANNSHADSSLNDFITQYASPITCTGATETASLTVSIPCVPDQGWLFKGELDGTDGPNGGYQSGINNLGPRNSAFYTKNGLYMLKNTGSTNVTVVVSANAVFAQVLNQDDMLRNISELANAMRLSAPILPTSNMERPGTTVTHSAHASSRAAVEIAQNLVTAGHPEGVPAQPQHAIEVASRHLSDSAVPTHSFGQSVLSKLEEGFEDVVKYAGRAVKLGAKAFRFGKQVYSVGRSVAAYF